MAKNDGILQLKGGIGELVFYKMNGKSVVRKKDTGRSERMKTDVRFNRVRENSKEFGLSSSIAKAIRVGIMPLNKRFSDSYVHSRLNALLNRILLLGSGARGNRMFEVKHCKALEGFEWNKSKPFNQFYNGRPQLVEHADRFEVGFETENLNALAGATHARFVCGVLGLKDVAHKNEALFDSFEFAESGYVALGTEGTTLLSLNLPLAKGFAVLVGVAYYQVIGSVAYGLEGRAMRVESVVIR